MRQTIERFYCESTYGSQVFSSCWVNLPWKTLVLLVISSFVIAVETFLNYDVKFGTLTEWLVAFCSADCQSYKHAAWKGLPSH